MFHRNYVQQHPIEVMGYAGRHGYSDLLDQAAPLAITKPLKVILEGLPPALMNPWVSNKILAVPNIF